MGLLSPEPRVWLLLNEKRQGGTSNCDPEMGTWAVLARPGVTASAVAGEGGHKREQRLWI